MGQYVLDDFTPFYYASIKAVFLTGLTIHGAIIRGEPLHIEYTKMDIIPALNYPLPNLSSLHLQYINKDLNDVPTPAPVIDRAIVRRNCDAMLDVCKALGVGFRAHVKSHKVSLHTDLL